MHHKPHSKLVRIDGDSWFDMITKLVGGIPTPLKNDRVRQLECLFPTEWTNKIHVPNHQPVIIDIPNAVGIPSLHPIMIHLYPYGLMW